MEPDQLPVEENLNPSDQGESYEEITSSQILDENVTDNIPHFSADISNDIMPTVTAIANENNYS
ncbi:MAG: hypothetical protein ACK53E_00360, partial [Pseudanabaena sp.]